MNCSCRAIVLGGILLVASSAVPVRAAPHVLGALRDVLTNTGIVQDGSAQELIVTALLGEQPRTFPTSDSSVAARMERARNEDVIVESNDALFDGANVQLGVWTWDVFLRKYGTALLLTAPYDNQQTPVFLIHGINGSPRDFATLVSHFRGSRYQPIVFYYPTGMPLTAASHAFGMRVREFLQRHPTDGFAVVGHSMGGLVAKGVLDEFDVARAFPQWKAFVAMSSPWRGVPAAGYANRLPVRPASWDDLAETSSFLRQVNSTPFPRGLAFYMFFGARARRSIFSLLGNTDGRLSIDSMMETPLASAARDVFGFYEDHVSILSAPRVLERLDTVLDHEVGGTRVDRGYPPTS